MVNNLKIKINLKEQKRKKSISAIIKAAQTIFVQRGFAGASMSKIAGRANVPQALIYHYFSSKEELWKAVKKTGLAKANQPSDFGASQAKNYADFLKIILKNRVEFYREHPELRKLVQWEALEGEKSEKLLGVEKEYEGIWSKDLLRLQNAGELPINVDPKLLSSLIRNALMGIFDDIPFLYETKEIAKKQEEFISLLQDILLTLAKKNK